MSKRLVHPYKIWVTVCSIQTNNETTDRTNSQSICSAVQGRPHGQFVALPESNRPRNEIGVLFCAGLSCLVIYEGHPPFAEPSRELGRERADRHTSGGPSAPIPRDSRRHHRD